MPRELRLEYDGAIYHLMNRGDRNEEIFVGDPDRQRLLETLGEWAWEKTMRPGGDDGDMGQDSQETGDGALADGGQCRAESETGQTKVIEVRYSISNL